MSVLRLELENIKNIKKGIFEIPLEKGLYAITGTNGSGKSTIINCLGRLVVDFSLYSMSYIEPDESPKFSFSYNDNIDTYQLVEEKTYDKKHKIEKTTHRWKLINLEPKVTFNGLFEGSFFYGKRFKDSAKINDFIEMNKNSLPNLLPLDDYIGNNVSKILHNDLDHYKNLVHFGWKKAQQLHFKNDPVFIKYGNNLVSQYCMSSGECLLISLFSFINSILGDKLISVEEKISPILLIIDEIEAALHPSAIKRLMSYFKELTEKYNIVIIISSHSAEVIRQIEPRNLYNVEMEKDGSLVVTNPCYPSYAIRDIYTHVGYDVVILTEDKLAQKFVDNTLNVLKLKDSRLINILPVGGWENVIKLYKDLVCNNYFAPGTLVFCILDGDVLKDTKYKNDYKKDTTPKMFLPIESIEKFLQKIPVETNYKQLRTKLNSYVFNTETIENLYKGFYDGEGDHFIENDSNGKKFYNKILKHLSLKGISEDQLIQQLTEFINECINVKDFQNKLVARLKV